MSTSRPFQVDLRGVVDLLSRHLYSSPQVYLRELLQNAHDAIAARRTAEADAPAGEIRVTPSTGGAPFTITDNGIGLTADQASEFLSIVGRSSKRDDLLGLRRKDFLGQFGIGILSCFMVADDIVVRSRSALGGPAIEWVGTADGTFTITELDEDATAVRPVGTTVELTARPDDSALVGQRRVERVAAHYGRHLPDTIVVRRDDMWNLITEEPWFLTGTRAEKMSRGAELLGAEPLDVIDIEVPGSGTAGVAFVLPFPASLDARQPHTVYAGRMLLSQQTEGIVPEWAVFFRCVLSTDDLSPTASREALVTGLALDDTREAIGRVLRRWLLLQATSRPDMFRRFVAVHELSLKSLVLTDDDLAHVMLRHLGVETSAGRMLLGDVATTNARLSYTGSVDEFRQVAAVVGRDAVVINGGYTFETELIRRAAQVFDIEIPRIQASDIIDSFASPALDQRLEAIALEGRAAAALADRGIGVDTRVFEPADVPALHVVDEDVLRLLDRRRARGGATGLWGGVLDDAEQALVDQPQRTSSQARLCLNWANPLVRRLATLDDSAVVDRCLRVLYVQALLAGHHPLDASDRAILTESLTDLVHLSMTPHHED